MPDYLPNNARRLAEARRITKAPPDPTCALRLLGSPRRREILRLIWREEQSAGEIRATFPDVTFGAVSQHLRAMQSEGFVECRKEGRRRFYRACPDALHEVGIALEAMWGSALYRLRTLAELAESRRGPAPAAVPATSKTDKASKETKSRKTDHD